MILNKHLLISVLVLSIASLVYLLFIQRDTSFKARRVALISILFCSSTLPFVQIEWPIEILNNPLQVSLGSEIPLDFDTIDKHVTIPLNINEGYSYVYWAWYIYIIGLILFSLRMFFHLGIILYKRYTNQVIKKDTFSYVLMEQPFQAFSFFNFIFISKNIWYSNDNSIILKHEQIHSQQGHSFDRVWVELLCVFQWFNPFIYWLRKDLIAVHEYLVDEAIVEKGTNSILYQQLILKYANPAPSLQFSNHFNHSLNLNRIKMIASNKSKYLTSKRVLVLIPTFALLLCLFSFQNKTTSTSTPTTITSDDYILPVELGKFKKSIGFGKREHPTTKSQRMHTGIDFVAPQGTALLAVKNATVARVQKSETGYGNNVVLVIDEQYSVLYAHMHEIHVEAGQIVVQGETIGTVGSTGKSTGPHLHFEIIKEEQKINPAPLLPSF